ncbi:reverse transcriptase domain-containing protein [Tanacetum coccineum]
MHTRASNSELVEPLPEPERTLNQRLRRRNRRVPFEQRNNPPQHPRIVYPPILDINYFHHFLDILWNYDPMDDEPILVVDRVVAPTPGSAIIIPKTANEFAIKGNYLNLIKGNQFDVRTKTNPHKHIHEFLGEKQKLGWTNSTNELSKRDMNSETLSLADSFPPALFDRLLGEIRAFSQHENESLIDDWLSIKEMLRNCHGHNLSKGNIIKIFYHDLNKITQEVLNAAVGGIFLYKTLNQAYQLLEDKVLLKLNWAKNQKTKPSLKKTVAFAAEGSSNSDTDKIMARMDAMTMKIDAKYKEFQSRSKQPNLDDDDIPMSREEEAKFILADKQSGRPSGSLPRNTQPNPKGSSSKPYQTPQAQNEHVNAVFTRSVGKFTFPTDFVILEMEEDSKVPFIFGRPVLHTADVVIRVKQKQLNLGVGTKRIIFHIDSALKHSYSNDDTCFSIDVIDEILEEDFDALMDEGSDILHSIEGTILEEKLFVEFDEFIAMTADENSESESNTEEPPFEKITFNTDYKIKPSLEEPPTDLELKPLPDNLEYVFLEEPSFFPIIISSQLSEKNKNKLISVFKRHSQDRRSIISGGRGSSKYE